MTTDIQVRAEFYAAEALETLQIVEGHKISSEEELHQAETLLKLVKGKQKFVDDERKVSTQPLTDEKRRIDAWYKPALDRFSTIESQLKRMIGAFVLAKEEERRLLAEAARQATTVETKLELVKASSDVKDVKHVSSVSTKLVWTFELLDDEKVPVQYKSADEQKLLRAIDAGAREIPGVRIFQTAQVRSGRG